jgi:SAM-dependent methyltransferase
MSHWQRYHARWSQIRPPLRPNRDVVDCIVNLAGGRDRKVLLLGVTPELADAFVTVQAVDKSPAMIASLWPGDSATRKVSLGDWLDIPGPAGRFDAVIGDGSLNMPHYPRETRILLDRVTDLLVPGGVFACRVYERPPQPISADDLAAIASGPAEIGFHGFKWQFFMHLAEIVGANIPVALVREQFNELFPDRAALAASTGWLAADIDTIDVYRGSPSVYAFPNRTEFLAVLPESIGDARFVACGSYDMAACCPILTFTKR